MGGCNSAFNDLELAGAVIGAGVATAASGGVAAAGVIAAAGASGAYFATKQGCSRDRTAMINATNQIIASAIIQSLTYCTQVSENWQDISITCNPVFTEANIVYEGNLACGTCVTDVFKGMMAQHALERKTWDRENPDQVGVRLDINSEYTLLMGRVGTCGIVACKACTLANISQSNILTSNSPCYASLASSTQFQNNLTGLLQQQLVNNQDVLAGVAKAFGSSDVANITENITNRIASQVTTTFLNNFVEELRSTQIITINSNSSASGSGIAQINVFQLAVQYVSSQNVVENTLGNSVFDLIEQVSNQQNTLNDIGTLVFESTIGFTAAINNIVGQVMIATLALLAVVVLAIIVYAGYIFIHKSAAETVEIQSETELTRLQKAAFTEF